MRQVGRVVGVLRFRVGRVQAPRGRRAGPCAPCGPIVGPVGQPRWAARRSLDLWL